MSAEDTEYKYQIQYYSKRIRSDQKSTLERKTTIIITIAIIMGLTIRLKQNKMKEEESANCFSVGTFNGRPSGRRGVR